MNHHVFVLLSLLPFVTMSLHAYISPDDIYVQRTIFEKQAAKITVHERKTKENIKQQRENLKNEKREFIARTNQKIKNLENVEKHHKAMIDLYKKSTATNKVFEIKKNQHRLSVTQNNIAQCKNEVRKIK